MNRTNNLQSQAVLSHASGHVWGDFITNKEKMNEFARGHVWGFVSSKEEMKMLLDTRIMKLCFSDRKDFIDKKKKKKK